MSRIILARHGETIWHEGNRYAGRTDVALTPRGMEQAWQLGAWAARASLSAVWSSPLSRARLTAQPAADAAHLPLRIDDRLIELDFGLWEELTEREMRAQFPNERAAFEADPATHFCPGGEDPLQAAQRGADALLSIAASAGADRRVLVVAHNTLLRIVLCHLLQIPLSSYRTVFPSLRNGAITELDFRSGRFGLISFNLPLSALTVNPI